MTVYVDAIQRYETEQIKPAARRFGNLWCHCTASTVEELHRFAARLGLPRSAFQGQGRPWGWHYDLIPSKRALAVRLGAVEVDAGEHFSGRLAAERAAAGIQEGE